MLTRKYLNQLEYEIFGACLEVHKALGPGLLESVYHQCLTREFELRGTNFTSEKLISVVYKGIDVNTILKADFVIEEVFILEIKAVESILPIHEAQLLTYMKLLGCSKGLLLNFNTSNLYHNGRKSFVNELFRSLPD